MKRRLIFLVSTGVLLLLAGFYVAKSSISLRQPQIALTLNQPTGVESADYSPDSRFLVVSGGNCTLYIWEALTGQQRGQFEGCSTNSMDPLGSTTFSPDGKFIAVADSLGTGMQILDATSLPNLRSLAKLATSVTHVSYSPDGHFIVTTSGNAARVLDKSSGMTQIVLMGHTGHVYTAEYSPDGKFIVTASADHTARIWDAFSGKELGRLAGHTDSVWSAAYSPNGREIITASADLTARVWEIPSYRERLRLDGGGGWVMGASFNSRGNLLLTYTWPDDRVRLWDLRGHLLTEFIHREPQHGHVTFAVFSPDSRSIATGAGDSIQIWGIEDLAPASQ